MANARDQVLKVCQCPGHDRRYAAAVLTRARHAFDGELASCELIGTIAAAAIERLRSGE